ncbi:MAG: hypothetical protein QM723_03945 [Myxococcaceae bacterium]
MGIEYLGELPIDLETRVGSDAGLPIVMGKPDSVIGKRFMELGAKIAGRISTENSRVRLPVMQPTG